LKNVTIEDFDIKATVYSGEALLTDSEIKKLFGFDIVIVQNKYFDRLTNDLHLPVIARNYLENGESKNLWYEQVIPRLSIFWSLCIYSLNKDVLFPELFKDDVLVQIGANGSIGYGYSSFSQIIV
jgi:CRISPR-associated protein Cmr4